MSDPANITVKTRNKTLAVFLDGTWNVTDNNTNVWRMYSSCANHDKEGRKQLCYYSKGVGTSYGQVVRGGMFGFGIDTLIKDAYDWLIANYDDNRSNDKELTAAADEDQRDRLFVFGFSRGAYAARSLAGLVARWGLPQPGSPIGVGELYARALESDHTLYGLLAGTQKPDGSLEKWVEAYCRPVDVTMVGVWDTVGALRFARGYRETGLRLPIKHLFQALAIDEHRQAFAPTLWTLNRSAPAGFKEIALDRVEQRWFVGAHGNVGGGYNSDLLPQLPLQWIMEKAGALGLAFRKTVDVRDAVPAEEVYRSAVADSFRQMAGGAYYALKLGRPYLRPIGALPGPDGTVLNVNETVDASVFERWRRDGRYRPKNLQDWAAARGVADIGGLQGSVLAAAPSVAVGPTSEPPAPDPDLLTAAGPALAAPAG